MSGLLPDGLLTIGMAESADAERFMRLSKQRSGFSFRRLCGERLWQEGYADRVLRHHESIPTVIGYIIANPVRAGLVQEPAEYSFWGSQRYTRDEMLEFADREAAWRPDSF